MKRVHITFSRLNGKSFKNLLPTIFSYFTLISFLGRGVSLAWILSYPFRQKVFWIMSKVAFTKKSIVNKGISIYVIIECANFSEE